MSSLVSRLAQFSNRMIGSILGRWSRHPQYVFSDIYMLVSIVSSRLKHIPYSNKIRIVFTSGKMGSSFDNLLWNDYLMENEARILDPTSREVTRVMRVLVKIVQALSDGLRLRHDCRVSASCVGDKKMLPLGKNNEQLVMSRFGKDESRGRFDKPRKLGDTECNIEHLDGLNWEVMMIESEDYHASYHGHGRIVMHTSTLYSYRTEEELASALAHEVGHGVAMHLEGTPSKTVGPFALIPWTSAFWGPAIFMRLCDLFLYCRRRQELEAFYIGLMLMASAGYDPRLVPQFWKKYEYGDKYVLNTFHPSFGRIAQMLSQDTVMDRAVKIYEQVRAGHGVPSFIEKGKTNLCSRDFNPFSVTRVDYAKASFALL